MVQTTKSFTYSDDTKKMEILSRLLKEGNITLEEAFILSENEEPVKVKIQPYVAEPYVIKPPFITTGVPPYPWFGINDPLTNAPLERIYYTTSTTPY